MNSLSSNPSFIAYAITATILCLHLMILWALTGAVRAKTKTTPNVEDASTVAKGAKLMDDEPAAVSRAMRVYKNAAANILPFLILGFVYVVLGAPANVAWILFGVFTAARVLHAIVYALGKQPWRTIMFGVAQLATVAVAIQVLRASIALM